MCTGQVGCFAVATPFGQSSVFHAPKPCLVLPAWTSKGNNADRWMLVFCPDKQVILESVGVAKVLQSEKNAVDILDTMDM